MNTLARRERYLEGHLTHFRNRWKKEYLTGMREYQKLNGGEPKRAIRVGDIVHIHADKLPRQQGRTRKVEKLRLGKQLRTTDSNYEESGDRTEISIFILFCQKVPFGELFSKIISKSSIAFSFL